MSTSTPTIEKLTCARCGNGFDRERKRGVKPKHCTTCTQTLLDEAKAAEQGDKVQTLHCERCDQDWTRPAQRGKPPKKCPNCQAPKASQTRPPAVSRPTAPAPVVAPVSNGSGHYSVVRLLKDRTNVPTEEQYKFAYIEAELGRDRVAADRADALKRVWATLEGRL